MVELGQSVQPVVASYMGNLRDVLTDVPHAAITHAVEIFLDARAAGRRIYVMGNGGSSATASHFVADLVKTAQVPGFVPLRAYALTDNTPLLTAWANDLAYERGFAEQITALAERGDVVVGISASGNSPNILAGLKAAALCDAHTIGLLGFDGGAAHALVEVPIHIASCDYGLVEDVHAAVCHAITRAIRTALLSEAVD
jgi:D-sedoheptulose 7-phosphate isomerase